MSNSDKRVADDRYVVQRVLRDLWDDVEVRLDSPGGIGILKVLLRKPGK